MEGFTTQVVLQGGWLQGIVAGEYNLYDPKLPDDMVEPREVGAFWMGQIDVRPEDIEEIKSYGTVLHNHRDGPQVKCTFVSKCINMTFPHLGRPVFTWFVGNEVVRVCYFRQLQICDTQIGLKRAHWAKRVSLML